MTRYPRRRRKFHIHKWLFWISFIFLVGSLFYRFDFIVIEYAENLAQYAAIKNINTAISEKILEHEEDFQDLVQLERDSQNHVTALTTNMIAVNKAKTELQTSAYDSIQDLEDKPVYIPIGNLAPSDIFMGRGPKMKVYIVSLGYIEVKVASAFTEAGINQTRHSLILEITAKFDIITPLGKKQIDVQDNYHLADTILVGTVPESYTYIDDTRSSLLGKVNDYR